MGTFFHPITLIGAGGRRQSVDALVDTGATFSSFPAPILFGLRVIPTREVAVRLANGRSARRRLGRLLVDLDGVEDLTFVLFGEPGSPPTIGAVTLETFLLGVDPSGQRLVPVETWQAVRWHAGLSTRI